MRLLALCACVGWALACGGDAAAPPHIAGGDDAAPPHIAGGDDAAPPHIAGGDGAVVDGAHDAAARLDATFRDAGASNGPPPDAAPACAAVLDDVLLTCGSIVCHDPFSGGIGTALDLSLPAALPDSLFGLRASDACGAVPYLNAAAPEQSLLILKLGDDPPCGDRMPAGDRPPLDGVQRACFVEWVLAAAARARSAGGN